MTTQRNQGFSQNKFSQMNDNYNSLQSLASAWSPFSLSPLAHQPLIPFRLNEKEKWKSVFWANLGGVCWNEWHLYFRSNIYILLSNLVMGISCFSRCSRLKISKKLYLVSLAIRVWLNERNGRDHVTSNRLLCRSFSRSLSVSSR